LALLRLVPRSPAEVSRARVAAYGLAGLVAGLAASILLGAATPAGASGVARALAAVLASPRQWLGALPYFVAVASSAAGLALAYRAGFVTIGADGQLIAGMVTGFWLLYYHGWGLAAALLAAAAAGLLLGAVVAVLRVWLLVNETLASLMLNYLMVIVVNYLTGGPWSTSGFTASPTLPPSVSMSPAAAAALVAALVALLEAARLRTRLGVAVDAVGSSRRAAATYGVDYASTILAAASIAGALAGLGGGLYLVVGQRQVTSLSVYTGIGYGYMGILAAWLAGNEPLASLASSMLIALLYLAQTQLQLMGVPWSFSLAIQAVIVVSVMSAVTLARYRVVVPAWGMHAETRRG